jgi:hypothetical protein
VYQLPRRAGQPQDVPGDLLIVISHGLPMLIVAVLIRFEQPDDAVDEA